MRTLFILLIASATACATRSTLPENCEVRVDGVCYREAATACAAAGCPDACDILDSYPGRVACRTPRAVADASVEERSKPPEPRDVVVKLLQNSQHCGGAAPTPEDRIPYPLDGPLEVAPATQSGSQLTADEDAAVSAQNGDSVRLSMTSEIYVIRNADSGWRRAELVDGELTAIVPAEPCAWMNCRTAEGKVCKPPP